MVNILYSFSDKININLFNSIFVPQLIKIYFWNGKKKKKIWKGNFANFILSKDHITTKVSSMMDPPGN